MSENNNNLILSHLPFIVKNPVLSLYFPLPSSSSCGEPVHLLHTVLFPLPFRIRALHQKRRSRSHIVAGFVQCRISTNHFNLQNLPERMDYIISYKFMYKLSTKSRNLDLTYVSPCALFVRSKPTIMSQFARLHDMV